MQFNVPQFETEDKLFGPFTVFQFLYVAVALVMSFLLFPLLATWFWLTVSAVLVGGTLALALVKVGGRPLSVFLLAAAHYLWEPKILIQSSKFAEIVNLPQARPLPSIKKPVIPSKPAIHPVSTPTPAPPSPIVPVSFSTKATPTVPTPAAIPDPITVAVPDILISPSNSKREMSPLRDIFNKMLTSASPIPFREAGLIKTPYKKQGYEFIQKPTGETIIARRVDYR